MGLGFGPRTLRQAQDMFHELVLFWSLVRRSLLETVGDGLGFVNFVSLDLTKEWKYN